MGRTSVLEIVIGLSGVFVSEGTSSVFVSVGTSSVFVSDGISSVFVTDGNWSVELVVLISVKDVTGLPSVLDGGGTTSVKLSVGVVIGTSGVFESVKLSLGDVIGLSGVFVSEGNSSVMVVLRVSVDVNVIEISELSVTGAVETPTVVVREGNVRVTGLSVGTDTDSVGCKPKGVVFVIPAESVKTMSQLVDDSVVVSSGKSSVEVFKSVTEVGSSVTESEDRVRVMMCDVV